MLEGEAEAIWFAALGHGDCLLIVTVTRSVAPTVFWRSAIFSAEGKSEDGGLFTDVSFLGSVRGRARLASGGKPFNSNGSMLVLPALSFSPRVIGVYHPSYGYRIKSEARD